MPTPSRLRSLRFAAFLVLILALLTAAACSGDDSDEPRTDPSPTPTATPFFTIVTPDAPRPTPTAQAGSTAEPPPATAIPAPERELTLQVLSPQDGSGIEISAVRVFGLTRPDAIVAINGIPTEVAADGTFSGDIAIAPGGNLIEVISTNINESSLF